MSKTRTGVGRGFPICFLQLACLFPFEVLLELLTFLSCDSLSFSLACLVFSHKSHEGVAGALASVFCPDRLELPYPSPLREHPSQSVPHEHRDTSAGPRLIAPTTKPVSYHSN